MLLEPKMKWRSIPFVERPASTLFVLSILVLMAVILWQITIVNWQSPFLYYISMLILILNLLPYFIITEYEIYDDRVLIVYMRFFKITRYYKDFGCFYKDKYGVMLSTFKVPRRLDPFRGQSLRFSKDKTEVTELIDFLKDRIGKQY